MSDELNWEIEVRLVGYARLNIRLVKLYPIFPFYKILPQEKTEQDTHRISLLRLTAEPASALTANEKFS